MTTVSLQQVSKVFPGTDGSPFPALEEASLEVPSGSFTAIVGPSGCGKSTLLRLVAGLAPPSGGRVSINGVPVRGVQNTIGFLFQHDALLPWKTAFDNVALGLRFRGVREEEVRDRCQDWIGRVGLKGFERHYPAQLSGGMRKRAALAQMLVCDPALLLMDEPFASLDAQTRVFLQQDLLLLCGGGTKTILFVTHDLEEAVALADTIVVMRAGPRSGVKAPPTPRVCRAPGTCCRSRATPASPRSAGWCGATWRKRSRRSMGTETPSPPGASKVPSARLLAALRLLLGAAALGLWEVSARQGWVDRFFFSAPSDVGRTLWTLVASAALYPHLLTTIQEALSGLLLGFAAGAALGWGLAQHRLLGDLIEPIMVLLNAIPRIILAPLFIMWFGIGMGSKVALSFVLVFVVVFFAVYTGIREVDSRLVDGVLILGATRRDLLVHVHIPAIAAWVFGSLRVTVGFAFTGAVVGEFIAASRGLGYILNFAQNTFNASLMMASLVIIVGFILLIFSGLKLVEEKLTPWKVSAAT